MVVNVFLFDDFEVMDAFGPVEILGRVPEHFYVRFISLRGGLITGKQEIKFWTEPLIPVDCGYFPEPGRNGSLELSSYGGRKWPAAAETGGGGGIFLHDGPECLCAVGKDGAFVPQTGGRLCV